MTPNNLPETEAQAILDRITPRKRVTVLVPNGIGRNGQEWKEKSGVAVMHNREQNCWVLNMGGAHGTPGIAGVGNIVRLGN